MNDTELLLIFVRNPELGKVKTRLAETVGADRALEIYRYLLLCTRNATRSLTCDKIVYYSDQVDEPDIWDSQLYQKRVQPQGDLGQRMKEVFRKAFTEGYGPVVIIGSDCPRLSTMLLQQAFEQLQTHETVLGPARDGGYYLLGMRRFIPELFENKNWSTNTVLSETIATIEEHKLSYAMLPELADIDTEEDLAFL